MGHRFYIQWINAAGSLEAPVLAPGCRNNDEATAWAVGGGYGAPEGTDEAVCVIWHGFPTDEKIEHMRQAIAARQAEEAAGTQ